MVEFKRPSELSDEDKDKIVVLNLQSFVKQNNIQLQINEQEDAYYLEIPSGKVF